MPKRQRHRILKMKDRSDKYTTTKPLIFDLPMRVALIGASGQGKTSILGSLLLLNNFYAKDFKGKNIYIISPSLPTDLKLHTIIKEKDIPEENQYLDFVEQEMEELYYYLQDNYLYAVQNKERPDNTVVIFDDISFSGKLKDKQYGILSKFMCNGRKNLISVIQTGQKYTQLSTTSREQLTGCMVAGCSDKQLDLLTEDHSFIEKRLFKKTFRQHTNERFSFFVINYSQSFAEMYQTKDFVPISVDTEYGKKDQDPEGAKLQNGGKAKHTPKAGDLRTNESSKKDVTSGTTAFV